MILSMRRALLVALVAAAVFVPAAESKTLKVNWQEYKGLSGGQVDFHVTKIVVTGTRWSMTTTVANHSSYTLGISQPPTFTNGSIRGLWTSRNSGFGLAVFSAPTKPGEYGGYFVRPYQHAKPALPSKLGPGITWAGTISGTTRVPKRNDLRLSFGWFTILDAPADRTAFVGEQFNWITDHTFRA
jgi:hypothetical protein